MQYTANAAAAIAQTIIPANDGFKQPDLLEMLVMPYALLTFALAFIGFYLYHALGITLGYHRLLSHRSLTLPKWLEYLVVSCGYLALEGSPIFWVATHRQHHRFSDHAGDPHSPLDGLWHAFVAWMWKPKVIISAKESQEIVPDLYRDGLYSLLHCRHTHWDGIVCLFCAILFRAFIYLVGGPIVLSANLLATALAFLGPLLVNTIAHLRRFGYESYDCGDDSRNVWFVALLSMGEGWHNNHHAFPQSARHGLKPREFDPTWAAIRFLEIIGIAQKIRLPKKQFHLAFSPLKEEGEPAYSARSQESTSARQ